jgi:hypothetical protein
VSERLAIFAEGLFERHTGKTAHGVIRYGTREVVAVIDSTLADRTASEVEPFCLRPVPIVATVAEAVERGATVLLIGVAPTGGKLDAAWRAALLEAIESVCPSRPAFTPSWPTTPSWPPRPSAGGCGCGTFARPRPISPSRMGPTAVPKG